MSMHRSIVYACLLLFVSLLSCCKKDDNNANAAGQDYKATGSAAKALLSDASYKSLRIELQYMAGFKPDDAAVNNLYSFVSSLVRKPGGITIVQKEIPAGTAGSLSLNDIVSLEKKYRTAFTNNNELCIYLLITNSSYQDNNVLGIAYYSTSLCLLGKTIHDNSGGFGQSSRVKLETTVMEHELGHILGLVNIGTAMKQPHEDAAHKGHCQNKNCLMYYAAETTDIFGFLVTGSIPQLDNDCKADLQGN